MTPADESHHGTAAIEASAQLAAEDFKAVFRRHPAGVAVVTGRSGDHLIGFTATSVISVSADPPILVFSVDARSSAWAALAEAETLVINFLGARQVEVSARFATRGIDRFAGGGWSALPTGEPVLDDSPAWLRGEITDRTPMGSSVLISVLVVESARRRSQAPLVYHDRAYHSVDERTAI